MSASGIRLAEVVGALSIATDLGTGQPIEFALESCILSVRLAERMGMSESALREVYYQALLRYIGCNVESDFFAAVSGDEILLRANVAGADMANVDQIVSVMTRTIQTSFAGASPLELAQAISRGLAQLPAVLASFTAHCEVAQRLAERLGFDGNVVYALGQLYERWDGKGAPRGVKGDAIAPAVLVVTLAQDMIVLRRLGGIDAALDAARDRRGGAYAPGVSDCFCENCETLFDGLDGEPRWETVLTMEPGERRSLSDDEFDNACRALADFVDIKSNYTLGHSHNVAALAAAAAESAGLPSGDVMLLRRAGWLHDIGHTGVSAGIWEKAGALSEREWEQVRLHPYHTERILARPAALGHIGMVASLHHERLDGSGYHRGVRAESLSFPARLLAAADFYQTKLEARPHRAACPPKEAADGLRGEVRAGRLDGDAAQAVLSAAGHVTRGASKPYAAGLSEREVEVLRLLARGDTTRQIADTLTISPKTADHHIQHIYDKIGISTRAAAALFAMERGLV